MILKPLKNKGRGSPKAVMKYLLDKPDGQAKILRGDPELSLAIAESLSYKQAYEVWVLSFEEKELEDDIKQEIIDEFERSFFPYFQNEQERYNTTWIEHSDKGRVELNLFMPKVDLHTHKQISLFNTSHQQDWNLADNFRNYINANYHLSNPLDPSKVKMVKGDDWVHKAKSKQGQSTAKFISDITEGAELLVREGIVSNRDELIDYLKSSGFDITRVRKDSISINAPEISKTNIKIRGELFNEQFKSISELSASISAKANSAGIRNSTDPTERRAIIEELRAKLENSVRERSKHQQSVFNDHQGTGRAFQRIGENRIKQLRISRESDRNDKASHRQGFSVTTSNNSDSERFRGYSKEIKDGRNYDSEHSQSAVFGNSVYNNHSLYSDYCIFSDQQHIEERSEIGEIQPNISGMGEHYRSETENFEPTNKLTHSAESRDIGQTRDRAGTLSQANQEPTRDYLSERITDGETRKNNWGEQEKGNIGDFVESSVLLSSRERLRGSRDLYEVGNRSSFHGSEVTGRPSRADQEREYLNQCERSELDEHLRDDRKAIREYGADIATGFKLLRERAEQGRTAGQQYREPIGISGADKEQIGNSAKGYAESTIRWAISSAIAELGEFVKAIGRDLANLSRGITGANAKIDEQNRIREEQRQQAYERQLAEIAKKALEEERMRNAPPSRPRMRM